MVIYWMLLMFGSLRFKLVGVFMLPTITVWWTLLWNLWLASHTLEFGGCYLLCLDIFCISKPCGLYYYCGDCWMLSLHFNICGLWVLMVIRVQEWCGDISVVSNLVCSFMAFSGDISVGLVQLPPLFSMAHIVWLGGVGGHISDGTYIDFWIEHYYRTKAIFISFSTVYVCFYFLSASYTIRWSGFTHGGLNAIFMQVAVLLKYTIPLAEMLPLRCFYKVSYAVLIAGVILHMFQTFHLLLWMVVVLGIIGNVYLVCMFLVLGLHIGYVANNWYLFFVRRLYCERDLPMSELCIFVGLDRGSLSYFDVVNIYHY